MKLLLLILTASLLITSCRTITALKKMKAEKADYETWTNAEGKSVIFLPMVHAGKPEFYEDVKNIIARYKKEGYVFFYEGIKGDYNERLGEDSTLRSKYINYAQHTRYAEKNFQETDSIDRLVCLLKLKRIIRFIPDSASYSKMLKSSSLTDKAVFQPKPAMLGISDHDANIDVSLAELVDEYEKQYGTITLEQIDFAVAINDVLPAHRRLKKKRSRKVLIGYRDKNISDNIQSSSYNKILVLYGLAHKKGTFKALKKGDQSWKVSG